MGKSKAHQVPFPELACPHPPWLNAGPFREEIPLVFQPFTSQSLPAPSPGSLLSCFRGMGPEAGLGRPENKQERKGGVSY